MNETAFVNQFWGAGDGGFRVIQQRIRSAEATLLALLHFYKERISIEKDYAKRLERLVSANALGAAETGSLKIALDKLQNESEQQAADSRTFVSNVAHHNYEKLSAFENMYRRSAGKLESHMKKVLERKNEHFAQLEQAKEKYRAECSQVKSLTLVCQTTWGRELEKNQARLRRAQGSLDPLRAHYQKAVRQHAASHETWVRDWAAALLALYQLEVERLQMCKLNSFSFCNHVASLCVAWDLAADSARLAIAGVAAPRDIADFARAYGTGSEIWRAPDFVEFLEGRAEPPMEMERAQFADPDYSVVLLRTFSVQTQLMDQTHKALPPVRAQTPPYALGHDADSTHIRPGYLSAPTDHLATTIPGPDVDSGHGPISAAQPFTAPVPDLHHVQDQSHENSPLRPRKLPSHSTFSDDMFEKAASDYLSPTNYTVRSWASPRKRTGANAQENINRRLRDMTTIVAPAREPERPSVPIAKDFSIDFIAKALEDLDAGGNGDVTQFRRSQRGAPALEDVRPALDYVDDSQEVATRFGSISFRSPVHEPAEERWSPEGKARQADSPKRWSPERRSYERKAPGSANKELGSPERSGARTSFTPSDKHSRSLRRSLLMSPTKSYTNLRALVDPVTPVTKSRYVAKAKARYAYTAREDGELSFRKGWNMYVIHKQEDNWYVCELADNCGPLKGTIGLVPFNYVVEGPDVF